jgi:hypothetical protein
MVQFSKLSTSWNMLELIIGNVIISEVGALMCFVINQAEKDVPYGALADTTECMIL